MFKNLKIGHQILITCFTLVLLAIVCSSAASLRYTYSYMRRNISEETERSVRGFETLIKERMTQAKSFRDTLMKLDGLGKAVSERDGEAIYDLTKPILDSSIIDILVIAAADGEVLARPHDKDRVGDNIGGGDDFKTAISGTSYATFMANPSTKLGYYCGGPITYGGETVGMVRAAFSLENEKIVDEIKALFGGEATLFAEDERINTTITENGKRVIGTKASVAVRERVITRGEEFSGVIKLFGEDYMVYYLPLRDDSSKSVKGILFTGHQMRELWSALNAIIKSVAVVSIVMLAFGLLLSFAVSRRISVPLKRVVEIVRNIDAGDLAIPDERFSYAAGNEIGVIFTALKEAVGTEADALRRTKDATEVVVNDAEAFETLATSCKQAADAIENSVTGIMSISQDTRQMSAEAKDRLQQVAADSLQVSSSAEDMAKLLYEIAAQTDKSVKSFGEVLTEMSEVNATLDTSDEHTRSLDNSMEEITKFITIISAIAKQTNLLALNAAIEASRAGEGGRGFAVVAEEVRKLAEESTAAAKRIGEVVGPIREKTREVVEGTAKSVAILKRTIEDASAAKGELIASSDNINAAHENIKHIVQIVREQSEIIEGVAQRTSDLAESMDHLGGEIDQIKSKSEETINASSAVYETAEEMGVKVSSVKELLERFNV
jgi:methyl-accepting chemotaxis protein